jgi:hypothetical protein
MTDQRQKFLASLSAFGLVGCPPLAVITSIVVTMQSTIHATQQTRLYVVSFRFLAEIALTRTRAAVLLFVATVVFSLACLGLVVNAVMSTNSATKVWMFAVVGVGLLILDVAHASFVNLANNAITDGRVGEVEKRLRKLRGKKSGRASFLIIRFRRHELGLQFEWFILHAVFALVWHSVCVQTIASTRARGHVWLASHTTAPAVVVAT